MCLLRRGNNRFSRQTKGFSLLRFDVGESLCSFLDDLCLSVALNFGHLDGKQSCLGLYPRSV